MLLQVLDANFISVLDKITTPILALLAVWYLVNELKKTRQDYKDEEKNIRAEYAQKEQKLMDKLMKVMEDDRERMNLIVKEQQHFVKRTLDALDGWGSRTNDIIKVMRKNNNKTSDEE